MDMHTQKAHWIERFAARLLAHNETDQRQDALEWAAMAWQEYGGQHCPERAAEAFSLACSGAQGW
ncbi:hypothetical protein [Caldimonas brevitalea]|uniref:Uncharacterized protein n=1 Tax=Caldimonas brevitalea TaxID=413882 RepID=A0A0G3BFB4_9BURK|nr:hypothetical protein [Caldimonas brevitalea]AKJ28007.1 hypothetical protein AAW51_1316 [Caldimonas brevitalea]